MVTAALLASQLWLAHGGMAGATERDDFDPRLQRDLVGLDDVDFDSGWVPADSPVQLRFYAHVADSVVVEMLGDGVYDWDAEEIAFFGDEGGGHFSIDVGMNLQASVRFDVAGITWESDILGPWDYAITSDAYFTPYLLPGHPERPVVIEDQTDAAPVASVPIVPDIVLVSGNLDVSVAADITASLSGLRIEAGHASDQAIVDASQVPSPLSPDPGVDPMAVDGVMVMQLQTAPVLTIRPHLVMSILGTDYEIFGVDIPVALPQTDDQLGFDPETMLFDAPAPAPSDDESGEGGGTGLDDAGVADSSGTGSGGTGDTDGGSPECCEDTGSGCGCRSRGPAPASGLGALLLVLLGVRRRRR